MTIQFEVPFNDDFLYVDFEADPRKEDDGIGLYEFHGSRGYDSRPYVSCERYGIWWDKSLYTDKQNDAIGDYLDYKYDSIEEKFCNKYKDQLPEYDGE